MSNRVQLIALFSVCAAVCLSPAEANACVARSPTGDEVYLPRTDTIPQNGLLNVTTSCPLNLDEVRITVNGIDAELERVQIGANSFRVVPVPPVGSTLEMAVVPRAEGRFAGYDECETPAPIVATVIEADLTAPNPPSLETTVLRLRADSSPPDDICADPVPTDIVRWIVSYEHPDPDAALMRTSLIGPDGQRRGTSFIHAIGDGTKWLDLERQEVTAGDYCVEIETFDAAGNEGPRARECSFVDPQDLFDADEPGCSVSPAGRNAGGVWLLLLAGVFGWRRKKAFSNLPLVMGIRRDTN